MPNMMDEMALCETLKLLFNITHYYPDLVDQFSKSVPHLLKMLHRSRLSHPPLQPPVNYLINALLNLDVNDKKIQDFSLSPVFPKLDKNCNVEHLINILDRAITDYRESELDQMATPVLNLIRKIHGFAPESVKKFMQWLLLPQERERDKPLGKSDTLASKLLRLSTSPASPSLRNSISHMLFELSDKDANSFVKNVGYGFAAGFLMSQGMQMPENAKEAWATQGSDSDGGAEVPINPITGQRLDREPKDVQPPMTEEEKEREAERLFVLFERYAPALSSTLGCVTLTANSLCAG